MSNNASADLSVKEAKDLIFVIAKRFKIAFFKIQIGSLTNTPCMFHGCMYRSYAIDGIWKNDFCRYCFVRDTKGA